MTDPTTRGEEMSLKKCFVNLKRLSMDATDEKNRKFESLPQPGVKASTNLLPAQLTLNQPLLQLKMTDPTTRGEEMNLKKCFVNLKRLSMDATDEKNRKFESLPQGTMEAMSESSGKSSRGLYVRSLHDEWKLGNGNSDHNTLTTPINCNECGFSFSSLKCPQCEYACGQKGTLSNRIRSVHKKLKRYKCEQCEYYFYAKSNLSNHINEVHKQFRSFKCPHCEYAFCRKGTLTTHIKAIHDQVKDFKCSQCDYACSVRASLSNHIKAVHEQLRDFKCSQCVYACSVKGSLITHINAVHEKLKPFECFQCKVTFSRKKYTFNRKANLTSHIKSVHEKVKEFKCTKCDYASSRKEHLFKHIKSIHI